MRTTRYMLLLMLAMLAWSMPAHAARSYDNCTGFITTLPAFINSPGTWCLSKNLSTTTTNNAITIAASPVVVDCNDFLMSGSTTSTSTQPLIGIANLSGASNVAVRHCNIRGFQIGLDLGGPNATVVVEDNHLTQQSSIGIAVSGVNVAVRRNVISGVKAPSPNNAIGISSLGYPTGGSGDGMMDIIDNKIIDMSTASASAQIIGIALEFDDDSVIEGNEISGMVSAGTSSPPIAILSESSSRVIMRNNDLENGQPGTGVGIDCDTDTQPATGIRVRNNVIHGFTSGLSLCTDAGGNDISP